MTSQILTTKKTKKMKLPEIEITVKYKGTLKSELKKISSSSDIYEILKIMYSTDTFLWQEEMILVCLNQANKVIGFYKLSRGGMTGTMADPRMIFTVALNCAGTTSIILSHNHPSGNLTPSKQDEQITNKIKNAAELLDIRLLDHIILTDEGYYSFLDEGKI